MEREGLQTDSIENRRRVISEKLDPQTKSKLGQFFTPRPIAQFMASLFKLSEMENVSLLDAGAGIGSLSAAFLNSAIKNEVQKISLTAFEIDTKLENHLYDTFSACAKHFTKIGYDLTYQIINQDFIEKSVLDLCQNSFQKYDCAILNPPYHKINSKSKHRKLLRAVKIETVNLYSAFLALAIKHLKLNGQLVAIVPRSFCNGPYYKGFRSFMLSTTAISQIHLFESRSKAFGEDGVLQENIIIALKKGDDQGDVVISTSKDGSFQDYREWKVPFQEIVKSKDNEQFIHVPYHSGRADLTKSKNVFFTLEELGCKVSTGPVVDFRSKEFLHKMPGENTAPLIYPAHFNGWIINYPLEDFRKYNAIEVNDRTKRQLFPAGYYTVVRRFSSKEEKRRIVARVIRPEDLNNEYVGFENHLNVFHINKKGLPMNLAFGLAAYLNSRQVDEYFRLFSGHTQVNATDLRLLQYPSKESLMKLGAWACKQNDYDSESVDEKIAQIL